MEVHIQDSALNNQVENILFRTRYANLVHDRMLSSLKSYGHFFIPWARVRSQSPSCCKTFFLGRVNEYTNPRPRRGRPGYLG